MLGMMYKLESMVEEDSLRTNWKAWWVKHLAGMENEIRFSHIATMANIAIVVVFASRFP
jgi:hypothetical protein